MNQQQILIGGGSGPALGRSKWVGAWETASSFDYDAAAKVPAIDSVLIRRSTANQLPRRLP
jgi:hypothetical protein